MPKRANFDPIWVRWQASAVGAMRRTVEPLKRGKATVFLIHRTKGLHPGIRGHDPAFLGLTLRQLRRAGFQFVRVLDLVEAIRNGQKLEGDLVAFTMDDGFADQADELAPVFLAEGVPLTMFLVTAFLDGEIWPWDAQVSHAFLTAAGGKLTVPYGRVELSWDISTRARRDYARRECLELCKRLSQPQLQQVVQGLRQGFPAGPPPEFSPMSWSRARELERAGIEFGSHTATHRIASTLSTEEVEREVQTSLRRLRQELVHPVPLLAWPIGRSTDFTARDEGLAAAHGAIATLAVRDDYARLSEDRTDRILLDRYSLPQEAMRTYRYASGAESLRRMIPIVRRESPSSIARLEPSGALADRYRRWRRQWRAHRLHFSGSRAARRAHAAMMKDVDWSAIDRVIFACKGNLCRSPYAEARSRQLGLNSASVGVIGIPGKPAEPAAVRAALMCGVDMSEHRSNSLESLPRTLSDLILCMDPEVEREVKAAWPESVANVCLLGTWDSARPRRTIADPFGGHLELFFGAFAIIDRCVEAVARQLGTAKDISAAPTREGGGSDDAVAVGLELSGADDASGPAVGESRRRSSLT